MHEWEICICCSNSNDRTARKDKTEYMNEKRRGKKTLKFRIFLNSYGFIKYVYNGIRDNKDQYVHVMYTQCNQSIARLPM